MIDRQARCRDDMSVEVEADESGRGIGRGAEGGDIERMDGEEIAMRLKHSILLGNAKV
jgi:hypothetical protein